jgi:uncharacterized protein (DUF952 family)/mannose-6-phosphate isomerase-like protein (cupin superfamily)
MPKLIGSSKTVVEHDGLLINELAGNVATSEDTISIANVSVSKPTAEPWLTLEYDEWICVTKGQMVIHYQDEKEGKESTLEVNVGDTAYIAKGERFRPVFPTGETEYIPVCLPAFRPDRCHREEDAETSEVTKKLRSLHGMDNVTAESKPDNDVLYHMCQKSLWESAVAAGKAYFPPTFEADGGFTHATAVPKRLISTANHFYTGTEGDWICLQLSRSALENVGITTKDEEALPVGSTAVSDEWTESKWVCPHIYGGISTMASLKILTKVYAMTRTDDGKFLGIEGLVE